MGLRLPRSQEKLGASEPDGQFRTRKGVSDKRRRVARLHRRPIQYYAGRWAFSCIRASYWEKITKKVMMYSGAEGSPQMPTEQCYSFLRTISFCREHQKRWGRKQKKNNKWRPTRAPLSATPGQKILTQQSPTSRTWQNEQSSMNWIIKIKYKFWLFENSAERKSWEKHSFLFIFYNTVPVRHSPWRVTTCTGSILYQPIHSLSVHISKQLMKRLVRRDSCMSIIIEGLIPQGKKSPIKTCVYLPFHAQVVSSLDYYAQVTS